MNITLLLQPPAMLYFYFIFKYLYRTLFINPLSSFIILERIVQTVCWFSLNNSETVKAATLAFCSIQLHLIRDVRTKFGIPYSLQSPDIGQNSDGGISDFRIPGQSLTKRNCHNS